MPKSTSWKIEDLDLDPAEVGGVVSWSPPPLTFATRMKFPQKDWGDSGWGSSAVPESEGLYSRVCQKAEVKDSTFQNLSGWWFQIFFIINPIWERFPCLQIFRTCCFRLKYPYHLWESQVLQQTGTKMEGWIYPKQQRRDSIWIVLINENKKHAVAHDCYSI